VGLLLIVIASVGLPLRSARAYKPESPEVQALVKRATAYLQEATHGEPGGQALIAMALLKSGANASHPQVQKAIASCRQLAASCARSGVGHTCYNEAIACIFFCDLDANQFRQEVDALLRGLLARQLPNGCWGYMPHTYDDTSQTQYGVLALWAAHVNNFEVPPEALAAACNWLMRVQDVSGAWSYRSKDPGRLQRIQQKGLIDGQTGPTLSMAAAGLGTTYICGYLLGFGEKVKKAQTQTGMPSALRQVDEKPEAGRFLLSDAVDYSAFQECTGLGKRALDGNLTFNFPKWTHYFMYGLERCKAFQELVEGQTQPEPRWYNEGVEFLRRSQGEDGSWKSAQPANATAPVDTAFAVLFLLRGTQKSIKKVEEGIVSGNKGLPDDLSKISLDASGKVVDEKETPPIENLLKLLEDPDNPDGDLMDEIPTVLTLGDDPAKRAEQVARLRRMAVNGSYQARLTAVKTLGRDRDLDNVPALIFALSDPDWRVQKAARDGLRFISRKFDGFGMPEKPKRQQWQTAQAKWKEWFLSVRPDGELIQ
jgi:hypothetical protein